MSSKISYEMSRKSAKLIWPSKNSVRIWNSPRKTSEEETALQGAIGFVDRRAFCGYGIKSWHFWMDKSKWNICFHNSLGVKVALGDLRDAVLNGQQKQENVLLERIIKVVAVVYGLCNVAFFK